MNLIVVRDAVPEDAQLIADLTRAAWAGKVAVSSSGHRETAVQVRQHLHDGGGYVLLLDGAPVGSVRWLPAATEPGVWEILRMGILADFRGYHLSQHLLEAIVHAALTANIAELRLAVRAEQTRLLDVYEAYGFQVAPELEYSHANPLEAAPTVMRRLLRH